MARRTQARPETGAQRRPIDLQICPECGSSLAQPVDWAQAGPERWQLERRCPECDWRGTGIFSQAAVDAYDEALDTAMEKVLADLQMLTKANMREGYRKFVTALHAGQILAEDF